MEPLSWKVWLDKEANLLLNYPRLDLTSLPIIAFNNLNEQKISVNLHYFLPDH